MNTKRVEEKCVIRLKTPLRNAINSRRQSNTEDKGAVMMNAVNTECEANISTPNKSMVSQDSLLQLSANRLQSIPVSKLIKTPLRKAIQARRKSIVDNPQQCIDTNIRCIANSPKRDFRTLRTPLRKAIESIRRKSNNGCVNGEQTISANEQPLTTVDHKPSLNISLKQAIEARRRLSNVQYSANVQSNTDIVSTRTSMTPVKAIQLTSQLLRAIQARRKQSLSPFIDKSDNIISEVLENTPKVQSKRSFNPFLKSAIEARRRRSNIASLSAVEKSTDLVHSYSETENLNESSTNQFNLENAVISATCNQLSIIAFSEEIQLQVHTVFVSNQHLIYSR